VILSGKFVGGDVGRKKNSAKRLKAGPSPWCIPVSKKKRREDLSCVRIGRSQKPAPGEDRRLVKKFRVRERSGRLKT
jgi:hypothetical protein